MLAEQLDPIEAKKSNAQGPKSVKKARKRKTEPTSAAKAAAKTAAPAKKPGVKKSPAADSQRRAAKSSPSSQAKAAKARKTEPLATDLMSSPAVCCSADATLNDAARLMWESDLGAVVVVDEEKRPLGVITDRDIVMAAYTQGIALFHGAVSRSMSQSLVCAKDSATVAELRELMAAAQVRRVPVVDDTGKLCGLVGWADLVREASAPLARGRKRGSSAAMLTQFMDALLSSAS